MLSPTSWFSVKGNTIQFQLKGGAKPFLRVQIKLVRKQFSNHISLIKLFLEPIEH